MIRTTVSFEANQSIPPHAQLKGPRVPSAEVTRRSFPPWIQCLPDSLGGRQCFYIYVYILQSPWWVVIDRLYTVDRLDSVLCLAEFSFWSSNWSLCSGKGRRARCRHFDLFVHHTCGSKLYSGSIWHTLVCEMQFGQLGIRPEWPVASHVREKLRVWTWLVFQIWRYFKLWNVSQHFQAFKVESFDAEAAASPPETTPEKPKAACGAMLVAVMQENAWPWIQTWYV